MTVRYFVVQSDDGWMIRYRGETFGPYRSRDEALLFAIDAAQNIGARDSEVKVLVEHVNDHFLTRRRLGEPTHVTLR